MEWATFTVAEQSGKAGYFAKITLRAGFDRGTSPFAIAFSEGVDLRWRPAVEFAVACCV